MQRYYFNIKKGCLYQDAPKDSISSSDKINAEKKCEIILLSFEEFKKLEGDYPYKRYLYRSMEHIQYCKIESFNDCMQGTMKVPWSKNGNFMMHSFGFYIYCNCLYLIDEELFLNEILQKLKSNTYARCTMNTFLLILFETMLEDDVIYLQKLEEELLSIEEHLLKRVPDNFYKNIIEYRKKITLYHSYYEQLMNMGDHMQEDLGQKLNLEEREFWQLLGNRAERLHNHVEMLRESVIQIMGLYQSRIDSRQNKMMSMLTVVTTIFFPLTLIAGWYGMNFPKMPEFYWNYSYPVVIAISIFIIIAEIIFFRRKKIL